MSNLELSKLSENEWKDLIAEKLRSVCGLSNDEVRSQISRIFDHYKKLNVFPKTLATLDVSLKVLVKTKTNTSEAKSIKQFAPFIR